MKIDPEVVLEALGLLEQVGMQIAKTVALVRATTSENRLATPAERAALLADNQAAQDAAQAELDAPAP